MSISEWSHVTFRPKKHPICRVNYFFLTLLGSMLILRNGNVTLFNLGVMSPIIYHNEETLKTLFFSLRQS